MNMNKKSLFVAAILLSTAIVAGADELASEKSSEKSSPALPRVLLIGDSICGGYAPDVISLLKGKAEVIKSEGNAQYTGTGLKKIDQWVGDGQWDVIHFNWGLWDMYGWEYTKEDRSPAAYAKRLEELVTRMEKTGAKLIWATTTPACPAPETGMHGRFHADVVITRGKEREYQEAALAVMKKHDVRVNDLFSLMLPDLGKYAAASNNVHFVRAGSQLLGGQTAQAILQALGTNAVVAVKSK